MKKIFEQIVIAFVPPFVIYFLQHSADVFFHVYARYPNFDIPMHFLGGVAMAVTGVSLLKLAEDQKWLILKKKNFIVVLFVLSFVALMATLWEFHEFLMDYFFGTYTQSSIADTMKDMFLGLFGALTVGIFMIFVKKKPV